MFSRLDWMVTNDDPFIAQALQYFARESVFVVCVSDGNQDSEQLSETR